MKTVHFIIFATDIVFLTGVSLRQAQRILQNIRKKHGRKKDHLVTITEFCSYCEFTEDEVMKAINNK